jgi:hypothetical protein
MITPMAENMDDGSIDRRPDDESAHDNPTSASGYAPALHDII